MYILICIYIHKWFSNIKLNKSAQWVERLYLCIYTNYQKYYYLLEIYLKILGI